MHICELVVKGRSYQLGERPWLMGIVNATPDSFSDGGECSTLEQQVALALELLDAGADIVDIGGESGVTNRPPISAEEEIERVLPLVERVAAERTQRSIETLISIDTYKPAVARAAVGAGVDIINDVSGLRDPELAAICAEFGAALVLMHTCAEPKQRLQDAELYNGDVCAEVADFLAGRVELALTHGVRREQLILDPGPDFSKTPAQTVELLRELPMLHKFGRPLLLAISRKDFIGALTQRSPRERLAGTLAALACGLECGQIFRVHDVAAARDFIAVHDALSGKSEVDRDLQLADELRWQ